MFKKIFIGAAILLFCGIPAIFNGKDNANLYIDKLYGEDTQAFLGHTNVSTNKILPIATNEHIVDIAQEVGKSVVSITSSIPNSKFLKPISNLGSGVIFHTDEDNIYIITNSHVVNNATNLTISSSTNQRYRGSIIATDELTDIAVVAIALNEIPVESQLQLPIATFSDMENLRVGDIAIAIGSPLGEEYYNSVTLGVISAVDRHMNFTNMPLDVLQTDAAINPGNSGGALVDEHGEIIGINTAKLSNKDVEGIGFALPINNVLPIAYELIEKGCVTRAGLGIMGSSINSIQGTPVGVIIENILPNGSAQTSDLKIGDVIVTFDGIDVTNVSELQNALYSCDVGDKLKIKVIREDKIKNLDIVLKSITN
ncbi:MAG: hypothetical protein ATN34_01545 [Epulopiscium sp. Nele67-Bin002]|nr:MAG: hypothetical protein ATN33_03455 [Epulopiscium sp. Nele67-Bin001]OON92321.1 MAG: hypothetical protein ATN34_01545 [Epulopiscium sp. Nele67-Bin002]